MCRQPLPPGGTRERIVTTRVWVAVDAGGSSTRCVVVTADGSCIGYARAGGANPISRGMPTAIAVVRQCIAAALEDADRPASAVHGVVVAMAGLGLETPLQQSVAESLRSDGIIADVHVESDAVAAFEAGTHRTSGYVLISGTGAAALRIEDGGVAATADGLGWLLGDVGSGFWIGQRVATAALEELDGRGPTTALTQKVLDHFGIDEDRRRQRDESRRLVSATDLLVRVYGGPAISLAELARFAFDDVDDEASRGILAEAAAGLATTLSAVMAPSLPGPVVVTGGVLAGQPRLRRGVVDAMALRGHEVELERVPDGLAGAVTIGLRRAGVVIDASRHAHIRESLRR
ncbi:hypothetical protein E4V99_02595 [Microbacterium sp. dk485]|nr:hypothetical protein E4V99_02595 [Microbacterium sp. dk485]